MQEYEFAIPHFFEEMANDDLSFADIELAIVRGKIRKRFTRDLHGTRYEIVGPTTDGRLEATARRINSAGKCFSLLPTLQSSIYEKKNASYDYGERHVCGERIEERRITQEFWLKNKLILIGDIPAGIGAQCGEKVVNADGGQRSIALMAETKQLQEAGQAVAQLSALPKGRPNNPVSPLPPFPSDAYGSPRYERSHDRSQAGAKYRESEESGVLRVKYGLDDAPDESRSRQK